MELGFEPAERVVVCAHLLLKPPRQAPPREPLFTILAFGHTQQ